MLVYSARDFAFISAPQNFLRAMTVNHPEQRNWRVALLPTLMVCIGFLVLLAVGSVMAVNWIAERRIVQDVASRLITRTLAAEERALRHHLDAAVEQGNFIAAAIASGRYRLSDPAFADFASGTFAAAPQIDPLIVSDASGHALRVDRVASPRQVQVSYFDLASDTQLAALAAPVRAHTRPFWGKPVYRPHKQETFLYYWIPIRNGDESSGFVALGISTRALAVLAKQISEPPNATAFILYGKDRMLAHPRMMDGMPLQSASASFPPLQSFGDRVIEKLNELPPIREAGFMAPAGVLAREQSVDGEGYFIFAREVADYNDLPMTVGVYVLKRVVDAPVMLLHWATLHAAALLGIALIAAAIMAGAISRPIRRAAAGATAIGKLDFAEVTPLPASFFREINSLAVSFNAMLDVLKAFGRYVPNTLVRRLLKEGKVGAGSEERTLAIMFTDIAGFTAICEPLPAGEIAAFINEHLSLISACVEKEGGTIDKFIGDAVMAFWGAPGRLDNPAAAACRAAVAIQRALAADNKLRVARGQAAVRLRIGVHMGAVVVGDIGAPNRINYTIVGDAVNAAQRLESLGKTVDPDAETVVLVSQEAFAAAGPGFRFIERGAHLVKGKQESIEVYQLVGSPEGAAAEQ
jgi:adenylate cyclase